MEEHDSHITCVQFDHQIIVSGSGNSAIKIINFGQHLGDMGQIAACLPVMRRQRRAKSLSGSYSVSVAAVTSGGQGCDLP